MQLIRLDFSAMLDLVLPNADLVVLASEVLDALEVERLDDALAAEAELGAAWRGLDGRDVVAVDLSDPETLKVKLILIRNQLKIV